MTCETGSFPQTAAGEVTQITLYVGQKNKIEPDHPTTTDGVNP